MILNVLAISVLFISLSKCADTASITVGPMSLTVFPGMKAQFQCIGSGEDLSWEVDGLSVYDATVKKRGITAVTIAFSGTVQSNLTVPATSVNNGTTVRCAISISTNIPVVSNYSTLVVFSGIGHVLNLRFNTAFTTVMWDPPPTAGVLSNLTYHLTVTNMNTGVVIINTNTTETSYPIGSTQFCLEYRVCVVAFSSQYHGDSTFIEERTPGSYYRVSVISKDVFVNINDGILKSVAISIKILLQVSGLPCPDQKLVYQTHPRSSMSNITNQMEMAIEESGYVVYTITTGIEGRNLYTAVISVVGHEGVVQVLMLNFSTYHIQHCDVHTDHTSYILVECTFAINSTTPGFVLIQDEHSQYTINTTLQRHESDVSKGSVNITDLPTGEYRVTVYDKMADYLNNTKPAYRHHGLLQIVDFYLTSTMTQTLLYHYVTVYAEVTTHLTSTIHGSRAPKATPSQSINTSPEQFMSINVAILVSSVAAGLLIILCSSGFIIICAVVAVKRKCNKEKPNTTDHIPVEDNPVYITMKKIDMNKNSAYETISISGRPHLFSL